MEVPARLRQTANETDKMASNATPRERHTRIVRSSNRAMGGCRLSIPQRTAVRRPGDARSPSGSSTRKRDYIKALARLAEAGTSIRAAWAINAVLFEGAAAHPPSSTCRP